MGRRAARMRYLKERWALRLQKLPAIRLATNLDLFADAMEAMARQTS